jgi:DNA repair protein RecN (Recombination protein N)
LIFDEVDTGVSGRVATSMAEKLVAISRNQQVLTITHQPQVAALGDHHYRIYKRIEGEVTETNVDVLEGEERAAELARMMSGSEMTQTSKDHAEELLQTALQTKSTLLKHPTK